MSKILKSTTLGNVKNGIKEAYSAITGKKTDEDIQNEKELKELGLDSEDQ